MRIVLSTDDVKEVALGEAQLLTAVRVGSVIKLGLDDL